jgi:hypothetical protein
MYEDFMLDEDFRVESATDFLSSKNDEEMDYLLKRSNMKPCNNCGEWVSKGNLNRGACNLCSKSEHHTEHRGKHPNAHINSLSLALLVDKLEQLR